MDPGFRRKELKIDDEDGLLLLQEEFLRAQSNTQPAAKATRIIKRTAGSESAASKPASATKQLSADDVAKDDSDSPSVSLSHDRSGISSHAADTGTSRSQSTAASHQALSPAQDTTATGAAHQAAHDEDDAFVQQQGICPSIPGILAEVTERDVSAAILPATQQAPAAFPAAVHRKQSKFALGRRKEQQQQQQSSTSSTPSITTAAAAAAPDQPQQPQSSASASQLSAAPAALAPAAAAAAAVAQEAAGIHEGNLARLAAMTSDEVEEAQAELASRFSPAALKFLKNRNRKMKKTAGTEQQQQQLKQQQPQRQQQQQPVAANDMSGTSEVAADSDRNAVAATTTAASGAGGSSSSSVASGMKKGFLAARSTEQQSASNSSSSKTQQQQQQQGTKQSAVEPMTGSNQQLKPKHTAAAAVVPQQPQSQSTTRLPPVACLRFSIDGQILELSDPNAPQPPDEQVLMRDNISRAAGAVPQGYTLPEIRVLVRSSHAPQRAAGFRMMAAVLRRAQPSVLHLGLDGHLIPQEVCVDDPQQQQQQQQQDDDAAASQAGSSSSSSSKTGVMWHQIWDYAVVALRSVMLCRLGLDDDNGQVLSAASDALSVLLGRSSSEMLLEEVAAATAAVSWPQGLRVSLRRFSHDGVWDQVTGLVRAAAAAQQQQQQQGVAAAMDDADVDSPEDLAAVDLLAGFMATDPLPRIRFLLMNRAESTECVVPLLSVLEAIAASSSSAAGDIVKCKGLADALIALLALPIGKVAAAATGDTSQQQESNKHSSNGKNPGVSSSSSVYGGFKVGALRLLRLLCAASRSACQMLHTAGLDSIVQLLLCTNAPSSSSSSSDDSEHAEQQLLLLEAMRIWRVCTAHGVSLTHMDLMFQYIALLLQPPRPAAAAAAAAGSSDGSSSTTNASRDTSNLAHLRWQLTAEAYQLVDTLIRHALAVNNGRSDLDSEMITPGCAAAIAQEAAANWIHNPEVLQDICQGLVSLADCALPCNLDPNSSSSSSANPAAAAAVKTGVSINSSALGYSTAESASSTAAYFRALVGVHPSLLVPRAFAMLSGFAAAMQYLSSYWSSLEAVPKQLAGELLSQLDKIGLAYSDSSSSSSSGGVDHEPLPAAGDEAHKQHSLATVLLTAPTVQGEQQQQQLGKAMLQHCVNLLAAAGNMQDGSSSNGRGCDQHILATHALGAAAAATVLPLCQLQQQLHHLTQQQEQQQSFALQSLVITTVVTNMLKWVSSYNKTLALEPWNLAQFSMRHYQIRLLLKLAKPLLPALQPPQQQLHVHLFDGLLCVLPLLGPGHEADALQALQLLFGTDAVQLQGGQAVQMQPVAALLLAAADQAIQQYVQSGAPLAAAAAGIRQDSIPSSMDQHKLPYPPQTVWSPSTTAAASTTGSSSSSDGGSNFKSTWCRVLLEGYAVTWLSTVMQPSSSPASQQQQQQKGTSSDGKPALPLVQALVSDVEGSRLPAPPEWFMSEILALPHLVNSSSSSDISSSSQQCIVHPVSAALLLALGLEGSSSRYMQSIRTSWKLEGLMNLLYLFNAAELLPGSRWQQQRQQGAAAQLGLAWQQPCARWAAAVLTQRYVDDVVPDVGMCQGSYNAVDGSSSSSTAVGADCPVRAALQPSQQQQQQQQSLLFPTWAAAAAGTQVVDRLVSDLADISMGDPLFSSHVALLLATAAGVKMQRAAWGSLAHNACLHLLPKPQRCIGGPGAYIGLDSALVADADAQGGVSSTTGTASSSSSSSSNAKSRCSFDIHFVGDMAKSLAQGDLNKSLKMGSLPGQMALHGIAAVALDQNAWRDNARPSSSGNAHCNAAAAAASNANMGVNVLRGVVRACPMDILQELVSVGLCRGLGLEGIGRALVQSAHGDPQLMEKVRQLMMLV